MFVLREINQMEWEMCSYLEWQLNVDSATLCDFQARVQLDFTGPGPYPAMVLPQPASADSSPVEASVIPHGHSHRSSMRGKPAKAVASAAPTLAVAPKKPKTGRGQFAYATWCCLIDKLP